MTKPKSAYMGTPEVTAAGVQKKGTAPVGKAGAVKVTHKAEKRGKLWLRSFVAGVLIVDMAWGQVGIYQYFDGNNVEWLRPHAMWTFGLAHAAAVMVVFFHKLE